MAANYGLLGTAAEGVKEGLIAYTTAQKMKRDNQLMNLTQGIQQDDQGNLAFTPERQQEIENERKAKSAQAGGLIADYSPASEEEQSILKQHMNMLKAGSGDQADFSGLTHHQIVEREGLLNPDIKGTYEVRAAREKAMTGQADVTPKRVTDRLTKLNETIDPNRPRGGNLAKSQSMMNAADRITALSTQFPDGNIPKAQTEELATAVAAMVSGGSPQSQQQINSIVPDTMRGKAADIAGWVTDNPTGREQQEFIKMLQHTAEREKDVAEEQVRSAQIQDLAGYRDLEKSAPDRFQGILKARGITQDMMDENGAYVPKAKRHSSQGLIGGQQQSAGSHPQDSTAVQWAKANPRDPRSAAILKANGL